MKGWQDKEGVLTQLVCHLSLLPPARSPGTLLSENEN